MLQKTFREIVVLGSKNNEIVSLPAGRIIEILGPSIDKRCVRVQVEDGEVFEALEADVQEALRGVRPASPDGGPIAASQSQATE